MKIVQVPVLAGLTVAALLLTGCSGGEPPATTVMTEVGDTPLVDAADGGGESSPAGGGGVFPSSQDLLDAHGPSPMSMYLLSADELNLTSDVDVKLISKCMADKGFTLREPRRVVDGLPWYDWSDFLQLTDLDHAKAEGYRVPAERVLGATQAELTTPVDPSPAERAYWEAMHGAAAFDFEAVDDGCFASETAKTDMTEPVPKILESVDSDPVRPEAASASDVIEALETWRTCVAERGFEMTSIPVLRRGGDLDPDEISRAVADVECKRSSGLIDAYIRALYSAQTALIDARRSEFEDVGRWNDTLLKQVQTVMATL